MGATNKDGGSSKTFYSLKAKTSDSDLTPGFMKNEKVNDQWAVTDRFNCMSGNLTSITHGEYEYQGKKKYKCEFEFTDDDGSKSVVGSNFNNLLYGILNSLCSLTSFDGLEINVWLSNPKNIGEKAYPSAAVKQNGEKVSWAHDWTNLPKAVKEIYKGQEIVDDSAVIAFWQEKIDEIGGKVESSTPAPKDNSTGGGMYQRSVGQQIAEEANDEVDPLPF